MRSYFIWPGMMHESFLINTWPGIKGFTGFHFRRLHALPDTNAGGATRGISGAMGWQLLFNPL